MTKKTKVPFPLETERLRGEPLAEPHLEPFYTKLYADPDVARTLTATREPLVADDALALLLRHNAHWQAHGFGLYAFFDRQTGDFVGRGGPHILLLDGVPEIEIAYAVARDHWRRGFATEIAEASVNVAFGHLGASSVIGLTLVDNVASRAVMHKYGAHFERHLVHAGLPHVLYRRKQTAENKRQRRTA